MTVGRRIKSRADRDGPNALRAHCRPASIRSSRLLRLRRAAWAIGSERRGCGLIEVTHESRPHRVRFGDHPCADLRGALLGVEWPHHTSQKRCSRPRRGRRSAFVVREALHHGIRRPQLLGAVARNCSLRRRIHGSSRPRAA